MLAGYICENNYLGMLQVFRTKLRDYGCFHTVVLQQDKASPYFACFFGGISP